MHLNAFFNALTTLPTNTLVRWVTPNQYFYWFDSFASVSNWGAFAPISLLLTHLRQDYACTLYSRHARAFLGESHLVLPNYPSFGEWNSTTWPSWKPMNEGSHHSFDQAHDLSARIDFEHGFNNHENITYYCLCCDSFGIAEAVI